jgi:glycosyltransferase involved in cell wall biosynthesis
MSYPVTVVIPTIDSRVGFLANRCVPSVKAAGATQIVVVHGEDNGNEKRNAGARAATQPYLLFVDDDSVISESIFEKMIPALETSGADFAYCGYRYNTDKYSTNFETSHKFPVGEIFPGKWSPERLRGGNYIDTTSLIRRSSFPGFDPAIRRFQDWDLWLTMAALGRRGVYVPYCLFEKFIIDDGISVRIPSAEAFEAIKRKHGL